LIQLGIPEEQILVGKRTPGGGTRGEIIRIRKMMVEKNFRKAIVITNWWHTKRVREICKGMLNEAGMLAFVVAAKNDNSQPGNWWKYRYEALNVLEEFPKLLVYYLSPSSKLSFNDDPVKQEM
ncbi:MAG: YdcF family protein, partial [Thermodesulfobacteriota bacterium]|nr:YdcF family protein [Thermodesulfobacteriota bacterium]